MTQSVTNIIIAAAAVIGLIPLGIAAAPAQGRQKRPAAVPSVRYYDQRRG